MALIDYNLLHNSEGVMRTSSLFKETCLSTDTPVFTLNHRDKPPLINLKALYMEFCVLDPTEFLFADHVFGAWEHWQKIANSSFMEKYLLDWREEASARRKALAFKAMVEDVKAGKNVPALSKLLIDEPWLGKSAKARSSRLKATRQAHSIVSDDIKRLKEEGLIN